MKFLTVMTGLGVAAAAGSFAACGGGSSEEPAPDAVGGPDAGAITIQVTNQRMEEVRLTAIINRQRRRIGDVRANSSREFQVQVPGVVQLRLEFRIELGPTCITDFVDAGPGDVVPARIPQNLNQMRAACR